MARRVGRAVETGRTGSPDCAAGDPSDAGAITAESALQGDQSSLSAIARRHGAYTALVAHAIREDAAPARPRSRYPSSSMVRADRSTVR